MVWSQYVYEATVGLDHIPSDEEDYEDDFHLSIEDWQIKYSDELWELWRIVEQLIHDAFLEHELMTECTFSDFAEFVLQSTPMIVTLCGFPMKLNCHIFGDTFKSFWKILDSTMNLCQVPRMIIGSGLLSITPSKIM
jgi:hypothetical protein